jgi:hypothetical protein
MAMKIARFFAHIVGNFLISIAEKIDGKGDRNSLFILNVSRQIKPSSGRKLKSTIINKWTPPNPIKSIHNFNNLYIY